MLGLWRACVVANRDSPLANVRGDAACQHYEAFGSSRVLRMVQTTPVRTSAVMALFTGLSAFPITPASAGGRVMEDDLRRLVRQAVFAGADSIGLLGSTGAYMFLNREQRRRAVEIAVDAAGRTPVIAGVGALRTDDAKAHARDAAQEGAVGLLLAPVSYMPLSEDEVFEHFRAVATATSLPICIYSNPTTTNFTFSPAFVARLSEIPTIAAIKLPLPVSGDIAADLQAFRSAAPRLLVGYSGDWGCKDALLAGADCWYSVIGGLLPGCAVALAQAARSGDRALAEQCDAALSPLWALFREVGSLRVVYAAANLLGLTAAQPPRPVQPLDERYRARLLSALSQP